MCIHFVCISRHVWLLARVQELAALPTRLQSTVALSVFRRLLLPYPPPSRLQTFFSQQHVLSRYATRHSVQCCTVVYTSSIHGIMLHEILYEFMLFSLIFAIVCNQTFLWEGPYFSAPRSPTPDSLYHYSITITTVREDCGLQHISVPSLSMHKTTFWLIQLLAKSRRVRAAPKASTSLPPLHCPLRHASGREAFCVKGPSTKTVAIVSRVENNHSRPN